MVKNTSLKKSFQEVSTPKPSKNPRTPDTSHKSAISTPRPTPCKSDVGESFIGSFKADFDRVASVLNFTSCQDVPLVHHVDQSTTKEHRSIVTNQDGKFKHLELDFLKPEKIRFVGFYLK